MTLTTEIGDTLQEEFYPQVKLMKWDNECNFSIRLDESIEGATYKTENNKTIWTKGNTDAELYEEDNEFKIDVVFKEKPKSNLIPFTIRTKELEFLFQAPLTDEEKEYSKRPDRVINSYAVYHKSKKNNKYETGKFGHLYRPKITDDEGKWVWCEFKDFDVKNESFKIEIPQDFLDNAVYPIRLDPDFGYSTEGGSEQTAIGDAVSCYVDRYTASTGDTITEYHAYCGSDNANNETLGVVVYDVITGVTTNQLTTPATLTNIDVGDPLQVNVTGLTHSLSNGVVYSIVFGSPSNTFVTIAYDNGGATDAQRQESATLVNPFVRDKTDTARRFSIWATYTTSGGGVTKQIKDLIYSGVIASPR